MEKCYFMAYIWRMKNSMLFFKYEVNSYVWTKQLTYINSFNDHNSCELQLLPFTNKENQVQKSQETY